jgi:5-methylthioadenosine/S-adenosylhomocysteine deaminase
MVAGKIVVENGTILTVDEETIKAEVRELMKSYRIEIKKTEAAANILEPYYREMYMRCANMDVGMNYWVSSKEAQ